MTFLAIRQMMSKYFDFIGVGRPELIEKDSAVEKAATNEGYSSSRAIKKDEDDGKDDADCLNDTYYFSKFRSKSSVSYRHEKVSFRSITSSSEMPELFKLLDGLRSLPSTLEKDGSTTEDSKREKLFVVVKIHEESDRRVAKSSTGVRRKNNINMKTGTFNCRGHPPLKTSFNSTHGKKLDNDDRIEAHQSRISEFVSLLERIGATGTPSLVNTELAKIYFLGIYKKCKCFLIYFFVLICFGCNGLWNVFFVLRGGN